MWMKELSPEEEDELLERWFNIIMRNDLETPALLFLGTMKPGVYVGGQFARVFLAPMLPFVGDSAYDFISVFEKRENVQKLIERIDQARIEKKKKEKEKEPDKKTKKDSFFRRIWKRVF